MASRLQLQQELVSLLGSENVYFQPPASVLLKYPCIVYDLSSTNVARADNKNYIKTNEYIVRHIFKNLSNEKKNLILDHFKMINHNTRFVSDGLYHDVFTLFY